MSLRGKHHHTLSYSVSRITLWGESGGRIRKDITMQGFIGDIENLTEDNEDFRRVLYTGRNLQLVLMALKPGEEIGLETHDDRDQFFRVEKGSGEVLIDGVCTAIQGDDGIIVPEIGRASGGERGGQY